MLRVSLLKRRREFTLAASFAAPTPGLIALFGRSGSGKTTLIEMIAGLLPPDEGEVQLTGTVLTDTRAGIAVAPERRRIGYVFQDSRLFPHLSVAGNLRYGMQRARSMPHAIHFEEVVDLLGLGALLGRRPHELSGGERQRVALGRALLSQPQLLLLDEPLASLDVARREEVLPYLERLRDWLSIPMVYVSHQFDEVLRLATYIVLLEEGRVLTAGHDKLRGTGEATLPGPACGRTGAPRTAPCRPRSPRRSLRAPGRSPRSPAPAADKASDGS